MIFDYRFVANGGNPSAHYRMPSVTVSFIIPVKGDLRVAAGARRLRDFINTDGLSAEIIVCGEIPVLDLCTVDIPIILTPALKGKCVQTAIAQSRGAVVVVLDADVPVSDKDIRCLIAETQVYDVVLGSRMAFWECNGVSARPLTRRFATRTFGSFARLLFGLPRLDTQCGAKAFRAAAAKSLFASQVIAGLAYDVELVCIARDLKLRMIEVSVDWHDGESTISPWRAAPAMFCELLYLFWRRNITAPLGRFVTL